MRAGRRAAALVLAALLVSSLASADPTGSYLYVGPFGGYTMFDGTLRVPTTTLRDQPDLGGRIGWQWKDWLGFEGAGGYTSTEEELTDGQKVTFWHASGRLVLSPLPSRFGNPVLFAGGGTSSLTPDNGGDISKGTIEFGGGLNFWLSDGIGLRIEGRDLLWPSEGSISKIQNHTLTFGAGLNFAIGAKARDTDQDGVPDSRDDCVGTPRMAEVNLRGCPVDSDGDLVFDGLDECPGTPAGATVDARGCPSDPDGDGVYDGIDECADTPKGATVDAKGCPTDSDGDGVYDGLDKCPGTMPGFTVNADGCIEQVQEMETDFMSAGKFSIPDLNFASGKADITEDMHETLAMVAAFMFRWPGVQIEIAGFTDSSGDPGANKRLSMRRAQAVYDYLMEKYPALNPEWISVAGYGADKPVATNATAEGRALNRRVEIRAKDPGALQQEIQKRMQSKQGMEKVPDGN